MHLSVASARPSAHSPALAGRIECIDFAKGYAIVTVVVYHVLQRAGLALYLIHVLVLNVYLLLLNRIGQSANIVTLLPVILLALLAGRAFEPLSRRWVGLFEVQR